MTSLIRKKVHVFTLLFPEQKLGLPAKVCKLAFLLGLLSFTVLLLTGFAAVILGTKLAGYWLMIHATFSPVFVVCAVVVALLAAGQYRFKPKDLEAVPFVGKHNLNEGCWLTDSGIGAKIGFWLLLLLALPVILTIPLSMLPWFGTDGQEFLYQAHRWSTLAFSLIAFVELYILIRIKIRKEFE